MEKVWFKLRQTDYPPEVVKSMGTGKETGPICIGHIIPDLKQIDFPVNRDEIEPFASNMKVHPTHTIDFDWKSSSASETGGGLGGGAPIAGAVGVELKASMQAIFRREVSNYENYDRLDTYIVQPDKSYVAGCLDGAKLAAHVQKTYSWSVFMITGVKVARSGSRSTSEMKGRELGGDFGVDLPGIATAEVNANIAREKSQSYGGAHLSDFVWAVRLAKVNKGMLHRDWSLKPYTKNATFKAGDKEEVDVIRTVAEDGIEGFQVIDNEEDDEALVIM